MREKTKMITHISRCMESEDGYIPIYDGEDIIFVNACCDDGTDKSRLLKHFLEAECFDDELFPETSRAMKYYKGTEGSLMEVCESIRKLTDESFEDGLNQGHAAGIEEGKAQMLKLFFQNGGTDNEAKRLLNATDEEIRSAKQ